MRRQSNRRFAGLRSALCSLVLCSSGMGATVSTLAASGCGQNEGVSGEAPAADAEMKTIVMNVFGMT